MSESSDGGKRAANRALKRCPHCNKELEIDSRFCNRCGKPQKEDSPDPEIYCINPACKIKLFTPSAQVCHRCHTSQKPADDKMNHELKTQQHKLETTEQHKAEVKNAVESIGNTQQKSKNTIKNRQNPPASQGSLPCSSTDAHDIPADQPQPESRTPPKKPKSITAVTADSEYQEETGGATLPQQPQAPSGGATLLQSQGPSGGTALPQQSQAPSGGATLPQQSQAPSGGATLPQQSQAPSSSTTLPQQSQAPSGSTALPQRSQAPSSSISLPQQSQSPSGGTTLPQQSQAPSGGTTLPQRSQAPSGGTTFLQQSRAPSSGATCLQQSQAPTGSATIPQQSQASISHTTPPKQQQLPNSSAPFPQQQHPPEVPPAPPQPKSFPPSSTTPTPAESGSTVDKLQEGNGNNHSSTDPQGQQSPVKNPSKPTHKEDDRDQAPDVAKGKGNSEQSSTKNQAISIPPKTATDTELLSQQAGNSQSASEAITKVSLMYLCHKKVPHSYMDCIIKGLMNI